MHGRAGFQYGSFSYEHVYLVPVFVPGTSKESVVAYEKLC